MKYNYDNLFFYNYDIEIENYKKIMSTKFQLTFLVIFGNIIKNKEGSLLNENR